MHLESVLEDYFTLTSVRATCEKATASRALSCSPHLPQWDGEQDLGGDSGGDA